MCPCTSNTLKTSIKIWPKADIADMEALQLDIRKLILRMIDKKVVSMLGQNISLMFIELVSPFRSNILPWTFSIKHSFLVEVIGGNFAL